MTRSWVAQMNGQAPDPSATCYDVSVPQPKMLERYQIIMAHLMRHNLSKITSLRDMQRELRRVALVAPAAAPSQVGFALVSDTPLLLVPFR